MKRIATIAAVLTVAALTAPAVASGAHVVKVKSHVSTQIVRVKVANTHRVQTAVTVKRHTVQLANAKRFSIMLHAQIR